MKSGMFESYLQEVRAPGHHSLAAMIEPPWGDERIMPLRFCAASHIELKQGVDTREKRMSETWLKELMSRLNAEHALIRQTLGEPLRFAVSLKGELCFKGSGQDIELVERGTPKDSRSHGLYFEVSHLVVTNAWSLLFQHPDHPVDITSDLGAYIATSHDTINTWLQKQHGFIVS